LFFDGLTYREDKGVRAVLISPRGAIFEMLARLKYFCTNNQAEYEAILLGLQILSSMGLRHAKSFGDSLLVVHQVISIYQCFDGSLNAYIDKCQKIIVLFDDFIVQHVSRDKNIVENDLAQQASGLRSNQGKLYVLDKSDVPLSQIGWSGF
jgi:ribonuclease HI